MQGFIPSPSAVSQDNNQDIPHHRPRTVSSATHKRDRLRDSPSPGLLPRSLLQSSRLATSARSCAFDSSSHRISKSAFSLSSWACTYSSLSFKISFLPYHTTALFVALPAFFRAASRISCDGIDFWLLD